MKSRCLAALTAVTLIAGCGHNTTQSATGSVHPAGWGKPAPATALLGARPVPTAAMFDSIDVGTIPRGPFALAGYTAGRWPTFVPMRHRWPRAHTVSIAISARYHADCLDVEPGDATPNEVAVWVHADIRAGWRKPCVYSSWWEFHGQVNPALARAHISRSQVWEWDASYTYTPHIDAGFDATQWTDKAYGRNLDESLVTRAFLSIAHPALVPPKPRPKPDPRVRLRAELRKLGLLLGAYSRRHDPHGHDCAKPPYNHAFPSARWDHSCAVWARRSRAIKRQLGGHR